MLLLSELAVHKSASQLEIQFPPPVTGVRGFCCAADALDPVRRDDRIGACCWVRYWIPKATAGVMLLHTLQAKNVTSAYRLGKEHTAFGSV